MNCNDAARALHAGQVNEELEIHLSACEDCRALGEDLGQLQQLFAQARVAWAPSPGLRIALPMAPWRRLAIAASFLVAPLGVWAYFSVSEPSRPEPGVSFLLEPRVPATRPSDREALGLMFLADGMEP